VKRLKKIKAGALVHWYKYSSDMIVIDGGWGTVIEVCSNSVLSVLTSSGIEEFPSYNCDYEESECEK